MGNSGKQEEKIKKWQIFTWVATAVGQNTASWGVTGVRSQAYMQVSFSGVRRTGLYPLSRQPVVHGWPQKDFWLAQCRVISQSWAEHWGFWCARKWYMPEDTGRAHWIHMDGAREEDTSQGMELWLDATEKLRKTKATKGLEFPAASERLNFRAEETRKWNQLTCEWGESRRTNFSCEDQHRHRGSVGRHYGIPGLLAMLVVQGKIHQSI